MLRAMLKARFEMSNPSTWSFCRSTTHRVVPSVAAPSGRTPVAPGFSACAAASNVAELMSRADFRARVSWSTATTVSLFVSTSQMSVPSVAMPATFAETPAGTANDRSSLYGPGVPWTSKVSPASRVVYLGRSTPPPVAGGSLASMSAWTSCSFSPLFGGSASTQRFSFATMLYGCVLASSEYTATETGRPTICGVMSSSGSPALRL